MDGYIPCDGKAIPKEGNEHLIPEPPLDIQLAEAMAEIQELSKYLSNASNAAVDNARDYTDMTADRDRQKAKALYYAKALIEEVDGGDSGEAPYLDALADYEKEA